MSVMHEEPLTFYTIVERDSTDYTPLRRVYCSHILPTSNDTVYLVQQFSQFCRLGRQKKLRHQWSHSCYEIISRCVDTYLLNFFDVFVLFCFLFYSHLWWLRATIWVMELNQNPTEATSAPHR